MSKDLLDQAMIEMKHMGWLAEHVAEAGGQPRMEHGPIEDIGEPEAILRKNVRIEADVEEIYRRQLEGVQEPGLCGLLQRILDHSVYHEAHFSRMLSQAMGRFGEQPVSPAARPARAQHPAGPCPALHGWTVGSLLRRKQD